MSGSDPVQPAHSKVNFKVRSDCSGPCLITSLDGDATISLGNLCQCWTTLTMKNVFHYI